MKLKVYTLLAFFLILTSIVAIFCINLVHKSSLESNVEKKQANLNYSLSIRAQVHYRRQTQKWKNILLRGHDKGLYSKYLQEFIDEGQSFKNLLNELSQQVQDNPAVSDMITALIADYPKLERQYLEALVNEFNSHSPTYGMVFETDLKVKGIDTEFDDSLDLLSERLFSDKNRVIEKAEESRDSVYQFVAVLVAILLSSIVFTFYYLTREQIKSLTVDKVTNLPNKLMFEQFVSVNDSKQPIFIVLINIDNFRTCKHHDELQSR